MTDTSKELRDPALGNLEPNEVFDQHMDSLQACLVTMNTNLISISHVQEGLSKMNDVMIHRIDGEDVIINNMVTHVNKLTGILNSIAARQVKLMSDMIIMNQNRIAGNVILERRIDRLENEMEEDRKKVGVQLGDLSKTSLGVIDAINNVSFSDSHDKKT